MGLLLRLEIRVSNFFNMFASSGSHLISMACVVILLLELPNPNLLFTKSYAGITISFSVSFISSSSTGFSFISLMVSSGFSGTVTSKRLRSSLRSDFKSGQIWKF